MKIKMYEGLIKNNKEDQELLLKKDKCDKYDYLAAVGCGIIGGLMDVFLIGAPQNSILGGWTDQQVDYAVIAFSKKMGWNPRAGNDDNVNLAILNLEKQSTINYDQRYSSDIGDTFNMSTKNHHMKSLSHSPDIVGLFFSILDQFTNTATFIDSGKLIRIETEHYELQGSDFISKLFCGVVNWFKHLMSDVAGSSSSSERGSGIVIPFYELFGLCNFGGFTVEQQNMTIADIAVKAFESGYDFRFGMAQAIPVIVTELAIRLIWALRRRFQYHLPLKECIPSRRHADLRVMLLLGNGTLCVIDGIDAAIRSGGNLLLFVLRLNLIAWFHFIMLVLKEVCLRIGFKGSIDRVIEAYKRINEALLSYLHELEKIDIGLFKTETEKYNRFVSVCQNIDTPEQLNVLLLDIYNTADIEKPWRGDFDEHMSNKNSCLVFK